MPFEHAYNLFQFLLLSVKIVGGTKWINHLLFGVVLFTKYCQAKSWRRLSLCPHLDENKEAGRTCNDLVTKLNLKESGLKFNFVRAGAYFNCLWEVE